MANNRGSQGQAVRVAHFAEHLRLSVKIDGVRGVHFRISALLPVEDAVGADVDHARLGRAAHKGDTVWELGVDRDR